MMFERITLHARPQENEHASQIATAGKLMQQTPSNVWNTNSRYNALHLSKIIPVIVRRLHKVDLIDLSAGSYSGPGVKTNRNTRIQASKPLQEAFACLQFDLADVEVAEGRETVILRADDGAGGRSAQIEYEDTDHTNQMREFLTRYNACLSDHFIDLPQLNYPVIERKINTGQRAGEVQRVPIGPMNAFARRVFSRGDWGLNGRFYGGWWQQLDKATRSTILIDDEPTVEVDFQGLHVAILSKEKGVPLKGDPYDLPEGILPDVPKHEQRTYIKQLVLTAINARDEKTTYSAFRDGCAAGSVGKSLENTSLRVLLEAFVEKNPHLADSICSDQGIRLMNVDSQIAAEVQEHFTNQGIPVLCIHDSFIVNHKHTLELIDVMQGVTTTHIGGPLAVSQDHPGLDQYLASSADHTVNGYWAIRKPPERSAGYKARGERFWKGKK